MLYIVIVYALLLLTCVSSITTIFIQISDIHIHNSTSAGYANLKAFNTSTLQIIHPEYVIASGDLALGYFKPLQSASQKRQWQFYESLWKYQKSVPRTKWLDVPGNHDYTMNELSQDGKDVFNYTASSWKDMASIVPFGQSNGKTFCLLGVDFSYSPHVPYWLNQFGYATSPNLNWIEHELKSKRCEKTIAYGHFPIALLNYKTVSTFFIRNHISLYLSGHLHSQFGKHFYVIPYQNKLIDLQLPSLAYDGIFRILCITDDWISFVDESVHTLQKQPIIIKATPPDFIANLDRSFDEWVSFVKQLDHITIRVYHLPSQEISSAVATMDGVTLQTGYEENELTSDNSIISLAWFWNQTQLTPAKHVIQIELTFNDESGYHTIHKQFSFDLEKPHLTLSKKKKQAFTQFTVIEPILPKLVVWVGFVLFCLLYCIQPPQHKQTHILNNSHFSLDIHLRLKYFRGNMKLYGLYLFACFSLLTGVFLMGSLDGQFFISFVWGTLGITSRDGLVYSHWTEIGIWSLLEFVFMICPMFLYCILHIQRPYIRNGLGVALYNVIQCALVGIAVFYSYIQITLVARNFPLSVLIFSFNPLYLPLLVIGLSLLWCRQYRVANVTFLVNGEYYFCWSHSFVFQMESA